MQKQFIRQILRETFTQKIKEAASSAQAPEGGVKNKKNYDKDYASVRNAFTISPFLKQNQVMAAAGLGDADDATARSLFSKKVKQETNEDGGVYRFDEKELASLVKVLTNPSAYMSSKK